MEKDPAEKDVMALKGPELPSPAEIQQALGELVV
jgi:hypothetical protein